MAKIYALIDPRDFQIKYVGRTKHKYISQRYYSHCYYPNNNPVGRWVKQLKEIGLIPEIIELDSVPYEKSDFWEEWWAQTMTTWGYVLLNVSNRFQMKKGWKAKVTKPHSEETKKRISESHKKIVKSKEWIENAKIGLMKVRSKTILKFTMEGKLVGKYDCLINAARDMGNEEYKKNMVACLKGRRKSAYGFIWKYEDVEPKDKEL